MLSVGSVGNSERLRNVHAVLSHYYVSAIVIVFFQQYRSLSGLKAELQLHAGGSSPFGKHGIQWSRESSGSQVVAIMADAS